MKYTATEIKNWDVSAGHTAHGITIWKPARSLNHTCETWRSRIKNAYYVLIGKYDALDWEDNSTTR